MGEQRTDVPKPPRSDQPRPTCCPVVELRQYTLHPGQREVLIELFDRAFVESQEAVGMPVIGQFRDLDDPDRFVFLRGFRDMPARAEALAAFYDGPVWATHREAANATLVDWSNVLLLRPARPASGFRLNTGDRPPPGAGETPAGLVVATIYHLEGPADADFVDVFERALTPVLTEAGAAILASFVTEPSPNTFPRLPVREGEHIFVWFAGFADLAAHKDHLAVLARSERWRGELSGTLGRRLAGPDVLNLAPTARSALRG